MKIGIDIDGVITDTPNLMKKYVEKYEPSGDGIKYFTELLKGEIKTENIAIFCSNYMNEILKNVDLRENARRGYK